MQLPDLRAVPPAQPGQAGHAVDIWWREGFCGCDLHEEAHVLQHEDQDYPEKRLKYHQTAQNMLEDQELQDRYTVYKDV